MLVSLFALALIVGVGCGDEAPSASCVNGVQDPGETGIDCGGPCKACDTPQHPCDNGVLDPTEDEIDCGGSCIPCGQTPTCVDGFQNQGEAGVDCGGPCPACSTAPTCTDGARNQGESDIDCAGPCDLCAAGKACRDANDCASDICTNNLCAAPALTCSDGVRSGDETDVDCGGSCRGCGFDANCGAAADCQSGVCTGGRCADPTCTDGIRNGFEADVDCGLGCDLCETGRRCAFGPDCASGACGAGVCVSCDDGVKNGKEADVDCGGDVCAPCAGGKSCGDDVDCASGLCEGGICVSCDNGRKDGAESDVDCGGGCAPCGNGKTCNASGDCNDGNCDNGRCIGASCTDGVLNQDESDVDCGGACAPCGLDKACVANSDCLPGYTCDPDFGQCRAAFLGVVDAGEQFTCVLNVDRGEVYCWGDNTHGQLGTGDTNARSRPVKVQNLPPSEYLTVGARHACVITDDGRVFCWGDNRQGQCGDGTLGGKRLVPVEVQGLTPRFGELDAGGAHTCAIRDNNVVACWGDNSRGQLGTGNTTSSAVPVPPTSWSTGTIGSIKVGGASTCVAQQGTNGLLFDPHCWGDNSFNQLGYAGQPTIVNKPRLMVADGYTTFIVGGENICEGGSFDVTCYGYGGDSFRVFSGRDFDVFKCAASGRRCCAAISGQRSARCWSGPGGEHETLVPGLDGVVAVGVGKDHACYLENDEVLKCSGTNNKGQLGRGTVDNTVRALAGVAGFVEPSCTNAVSDFGEDGVDCGGPCSACASGPTPTCNDGQQNQGETGVDCGGPCQACAATPTCNDGQQNQGETGVDCGGPCQPCAPPPTCNDGQQNQGEAGVDCGGPCQPCAATPTCNDGQQNQGETGVDCGGPCPACSGSGTCSDQVLNQGETRVDCGGPCAACPTLTQISAIQQSTGSVDCTVNSDQTIAGGERTIEGVITVDSYDFTASLGATFISDGTQNPWSATMVRFPRTQGWSFRAGQRVRLTGFHHEYFCHTQFRVTAYQPIGNGTVPAPKVIAKNSSLSELERWEGVIVRMNDVNVTGHTSFDDAETDAGILIDSFIMRDLFTVPAIGTNLTSVSGALVYTFNLFRISPRTAADL